MVGVRDCLGCFLDSEKLFREAERRVVTRRWKGQDLDDFLAEMFEVLCHCARGVVGYLDERGLRRSPLGMDGARGMMKYNLAMVEYRKFVATGEMLPLLQGLRLIEQGNPGIKRLLDSLTDDGWQLQGAQLKPPAPGPRMTASIWPALVEE